MFAHLKQMKAYADFYHKRNIDSLMFAVGPVHVLRPNTALNQMENVINATLTSGSSGSTFVPRSIIFHHFSVGGYLFGQMLRILDMKKEKYPKYKESIKAQIFDSPPDIAGLYN